MPAIDPRSGGASKFDTWNKELAEQQAEIPTVDFGPTYAYKPSSRPGTSGTLTPGDMEKRRSRRLSSGDRLRAASGDRLRNSSRDRLSGYFEAPAVSPADSRRQSYFGGRATPTGIEVSDTPGDSVAWTPGGTIAGASTDIRQSLTPEQWVQWRASIASQSQQAPVRKSATPLYAHQRNSSSPALTMTKSRQSMIRTPPPFSRSPSGDWTQQGQQRTPPSRPVSRGAGVYLSQGNSRSMANLSSATLTAKEQMHVARTTGTPLINMASSAKPKQEEQSGLVAALANREREKAAMTQGLRSASVQQAILARQQQAQMEADARAQAEYEMQMRYSQRLQAEQFQQMAYQQSLIAQQQHAQMQQLQSRASWYGPMQTQQGYDVPSSQSSQFGVPASAHGGQYGQNHQQQRSYSGPYVSQQGGLPRRR